MPRACATSPTGRSARSPAASSNARFSVAQGAHVYLLDEPFTGLYLNAQAVLSGLLRTLAQTEGKLVVVSHHDLRTVEELFDDVIFLNGELVAFGPVKETFTPENIARTYATEIFTGTTH